MVASANPSGNNQDNSSFNGVSGTAASIAEVSGNSENSGMKHVPAPGISTDWTPEEKNTLEEGLQKYSTLSPVMRYAKIAQTLPNKTLRDVALHCRYMKVQMLPYQCITLIVVNLYTCSELLNLPCYTYILKPSMAPDLPLKRKTDIPCKHLSVKPLFRKKRSAREGKMNHQGKAKIRRKRSLIRHQSHLICHLCPAIILILGCLFLLMMMASLTKILDAFVYA